MKKLVELITAIVLSVILFPIALIFNIFLLKKGSVFKTICQAVKEIVKLIFDTFEQIAIWIDRLGNVILGNMFEIFFIQKKYYGKTLFDKSEITISSSFGHALEYIYLNKKGLRFAGLLDKILGKNHCKNAYKWKVTKDKFNKNNKTGIS